MKSEVLLLSFVLVSDLLLQATSANPKNRKNITCSGTDRVYAYDLTDTMTEDTIIVENTDVRSLVDTSCDVVELLNNKKVVLAKNLTSVCAKTFTCTFTCDGNNGNIDLIGNVNHSEMYEFKFDSPSYNATIYELTPTPAKLVISPPITMSIEGCGNSTGNDDRFELKDDTGLFHWAAEASSDSLELIGKGLDYEQTKSIDVTLIYTHVLLRGSATATIRIDIKDADDQNPKFDQEIYHLNITEENVTFIGREIETTPPVHAYDQDFGINTRVEYSIEKQDVSGLFKINNSTGLVSVNRTLDREKNAFYTLFIKAAQTDDLYRTATATLSVTVLDIDDNPPQFDIDTYTVSINEHVSDGTTIIVVTATDPDEGDNANFTYIVTNTSLPVKINPTSGHLMVKDSALFDREHYANGMIVQVETVSSNPGNSTLVNITLIDINDNNPNFTEKQYTFETANETESGIVGAVFASDADEGPNANVTYSKVASSVSSQGCIGGSNTFPFTVDVLTGNVTANGERFCEVYNGLVEACDNPVQISTRRCSVVPIQIRHNTTTASRNISQSMTVLENSPINTTVGVVECPGNQYTIQNNDGKFIIDASTGLVRTNKPLDRETTPHHLVLVNVTNQGRQLCLVNVSIRVTDVNDNAPSFIDVNGYVFNLTGSPEIEIGIVKAEDADEEHNTLMRYYLQNQGEVRFHINDTNGKIFTSNAHSNVDTDIVRITVVAEDQGTPSLKSTEYVYILPKNQPPNLIPLHSSLSEAEINKKKTDLDRELSEVTGVQMNIHNVENREHGTVLQMVYVNDTLDRRTVLAAIVDNYDAVRATFFSSEARLMTENGDQFGAAEIGLIAMGVVILLGLILAVFIIRRQWDRAQNYQHLYESLTRNSSIYESQEIKVKMDDDTSQLNDYTIPEELTPNQVGVVTATVNPIFNTDEAVDETDVKIVGTVIADTAGGANSLDSSVASVDDAIESLDQLSDRLDQEEEEEEEGENGSAVVYDHVNINTYKLNEGATTDTSSTDSLRDDTTADTFNVNKNTDILVDGDNGAVIISDSNADAENDDEDDDEDDAVESHLAQKILQASSGSPVMSRRNREEDDDAVEQNEDEIEEPNPDYDIKQVRFSTEVLDATENKIEPLKEAKGETKPDVDVIDEEEQNKHMQQSDSEKNLDSRDGNEENGNLMLEEEINSPVDLLPPESTQSEFYFGANEESTHF